MRQSLQVVTTSPLLAPTQLPPVSAQPLTTPHHEDTEHVNSTGTRTQVQAAVQSTPHTTPTTIFSRPLSSLQPSVTLEYANPYTIVPAEQLTLLPSQLAIGSSPPLPAGYQLPSRLSLGSPPPLVPISTGSRPAVGDPFSVCFVQGNISRCNGCKGRIRRGEDKKPLPPPDDIVLRHMEFVIFQNPNTGMFQQTHTPRNVYYHAQKTCCPSLSALQPYAAHCR